jgi:hypothetical protein
MTLSTIGSMTQKQTIRLIRSMGLTCNRTPYGEYRINLRPAFGGTEDTAYYTNDSRDALLTAMHIVQFHQVPQ